MEKEVKCKETFRNWVFTLNNYTDEDIARLASPYEQVKFIAYGKEIAPTTNTPHSQGYVIFWSLMTCAVLLFLLLTSSRNSLTATLFAELSKAVSHGSSPKSSTYTPTRVENRDRQHSYLSF